VINRMMRRVLLVESEEPMARVLERELSRVHSVIRVPTVARALALLDQGTRVNVVVAAYHLRDGTATRLFEVVARRWHNVRRVLLRDQRTGGPARRAMADVVIDHASNFADLLDAITPT
jgi:DNA-binding NtrC family response regulator